MARNDDSIHYASLPLVSVLPNKRMNKAIKLLEELDSITAQKETIEDRETEIKAELETLQTVAGTLGLRYGTLCFAARTMSGRRTLDKGLLMENGVAPEVIESSMKEGAPYVQRTFKRLPG